MHVDDFLGGEIELDDGDTCGFEVSEEADFAGLEEEEGATAAVGTTGCTAYSVDVVAWVVGGFELDDPVYVWDLGWVLVE